MAIYCVDGIVGVGKTTVLDELEERGYTVVREDVSSWQPYLDLFYTNPARWSFTLQMQALQSLAVGKPTAGNGPIIVERDPAACKVFSANSFAMGYMTDLEYSLFERCYDVMTWQPDMVFFLDAPVSTCMERIRRRDRSCESSITADYVSRLNNMYPRRGVVIDATTSTSNIVDEIEEWIENDTKSLRKRL